MTDEKKRALCLALEESARVREVWTDYYSVDLKHPNGVNFHNHYVTKRGLPLRFTVSMEDGSSVELFGDEAERLWKFIRESTRPSEAVAAKRESESVGAILTALSKDKGGAAMTDEEKQEIREAAIRCFEAREVRSSLDLRATSTDPEKRKEQAIQYALANAEEALAQAAMRKLMASLDK